MQVQDAYWYRYISFEPLRVGSARVTKNTVYGIGVDVDTGEFYIWFTNSNERVEITYDDVQALYNASRPYVGKVAGTPISSGVAPNILLRERSHAKADLPEEPKRPPKSAIKPKDPTPTVEDEATINARAAEVSIPALLNSVKGKAEKAPFLYGLRSKPFAPGNWPRGETTAWGTMQAHECRALFPDVPLSEFRFGAFFATKPISQSSLDLFDLSELTPYLAVAIMDTPKEQPEEPKPEIELPTLLKRAKQIMEDGAPYVYGFRLRPFGLGTWPNTQTDVEGIFDASQAAEMLPDVNTALFRHGIMFVTKELDARTLYNFDLSDLTSEMRQAVYGKDDATKQAEADDEKFAETMYRDMATYVFKQLAEDQSYGFGDATEQAMDAVYDRMREDQNALMKVARSTPLFEQRKERRDEFLRFRALIRDPNVDDMHRVAYGMWESGEAAKIIEAELQRLGEEGNGDAPAEPTPAEPPKMEYEYQKVREGQIPNNPTPNERATTPVEFKNLTAPVQTQGAGTVYPCTDPEIIEMMNKIQNHMGNIVPMKLDYLQWGIGAFTAMVTSRVSAHQLMVINPEQLKRLYGRIDYTVLGSAVTHEMGHYCLNQIVKNSDVRKFKAAVAGMRLHSSQLTTSGSTYPFYHEQFAMLCEFGVWGTCIRGLQTTKGWEIVGKYFDLSQHITPELIEKYP